MDSVWPNGHSNGLLTNGNGGYTINGGTNLSSPPPPSSHPPASVPYISPAYTNGIHNHGFDSYYQTHPHHHHHHQNHHSPPPAAPQYKGDQLPVMSDQLGIQVRNLSFSYSKSMNRYLHRQEKIERELQYLQSIGCQPPLHLPKPLKRPKKYRENLSEINMNIPRGTIYGLLGPSGCGKTTLLRCLVGCLPVAKGQISIFGLRPGSRHSELPGRRIGFMPQEFALYEDLTIAETLHYFGRLYLLSDRAIQSRTDELMRMLDMPESSRNVNNLSGGQRRRVSFAVALLHRPPLLILDEPTAGVDPLLRERVWLHLLGLCESQRTTIILTTQYIEETRRAHQVAFMRNGRLVAEQSPEWLLATYQTQTLEDAFLKICLQEKMAKRQQRQSIMSTTPAADQNNGQGVDVSTTTLDVGLAANKTEPIKSDSPTPASLQLLIDRKPIQLLDPDSLPRPSWSQQFHKWFTIFTALLWKNYLTDLRDPLAICFQFVLPITQVILFSLCIGGSPVNIPIGVVNEEVPNTWGSSLTNTTTTSGELSPLFMRHINNSLIQIRTYPDMESAWAAARRLDVWAIIHIRKNFTDALYERLENGESLYSTGDDDDTNDTKAAELRARLERLMNEPANHIPDELEKQFNPILNGRITVHADMTNKIVTLTTMRNFFYQYQDFFRAVLIDGGYSRSLAAMPIQLRDPIYGEYKQYDYNGFRDFMIPGIMCNITFAIAYTLTAVTLIKERNGQTIERNHVAGVGRTQLLAAHALARFSLMVPYAMVIIYLPVVMFELPALGSLHQVFWLLLMINLSGMSYGMFVSSLCATVEMAIILAAGTMFFLMFACGAIWPLEAVPSGFRWFAFSTPLALPTETLRNILFKGWGLDQPGVWHGFAVCILYVLFFSWAGLKTFRMNK